MVLGGNLHVTSIAARAVPESVLVPNIRALHTDRASTTYRMRVRASQNNKQECKITSCTRTGTTSDKRTLTFAGVLDVHLVHDGGVQQSLTAARGDGGAVALHDTNSEQ